MATPSKQFKPNPNDEDVTISGYVHDLSPIKLSPKNISYFNCKIQTDKQSFADIVSFAPERRALFVQARDRKTALKLQGVAKSLSYTSPNGYNYKVNKKTTIDKESVAYPFREIPTQKVETVTLDKVRTKSTSDHVTTSGKVVHCEDASEVLSRAGHHVLLQNVTIADATSSCRLSLWDKHANSLHVEECYLFQNVVIKEYQNEKLLSAISASTIVPCTDIQDVKYTPPVPSTLTGTPILASVQVHKLCLGCRNKIEHDHTKLTVKCTKCQMRQSTKQLKSVVTCIIQMHDSERLTVPSDIMHTFCTSTPQNLALDADEIEEFLLQNEVNITITNGHVSNMEHITDN